MNFAKLQDTKSIHRNHLHFYILTSDYNITFVVLGSVMKELALKASSLGPETVEGIMVVTIWIEKILTDLKVQHK